MKKEASEPNGNETYIYRRILSWCGEHKMKLAVIVGTLLLGTMFGGHLYQEQQQSFKINVTLNSDDVLIGEEMELTVIIKPLEHIDGDFLIELEPESYNYIFMKKSQEGEEQLDCTSERGTCRYSIANVSLESGEDRKYKFYVTSTCESTEAKWYIQVYVRYKPDGSGDYTEEHAQKIYFTVKKEKDCWLTSLFSVIILVGVIVRK